MAQMDRFICTNGNPWSSEKGERAVHPGAVETGSQRDGWPGGDMQGYECPFCHKRFEVELPQ